MLHLKGEESKNRTENFYSRAISRTRLLSNYLLVSIVVSIILQALLAAGLWLVSAAVMDVAFDFGTIMASVLVYLPAMWIVVGLAVWLIGIRPKATGLVWFYLTYGFIVLYLGELLNFPAWATNLSAFVHVPELLIEDMEPLKLAIMMGIAVVLMVVGFIGYNRRDLEG